MNAPTVKKESSESASFLTLPDGRKLAYRLSEGSLPGVVFMGGFRSDMTGSKATSLEAHCRKAGRRYLRFDYSGHGESSGDFLRCTIGGWKEDALAMLDHVAQGENIIVGSSMGAWVMLLAALERKEKVRGLLGLASAPDFTEDLMWDVFTEDQRHALLQSGVLPIASCYGQDPYPITRQLIEEGRKNLLLRETVALSCPVRLIHGTEDDDVPWQVSMALLEKLESKDVSLQLIKGAGHRLSEPENLEMVAKTLDALLIAAGT